MTKKQQTILLAVIASLAMIAIAVVAAGVWLYTSVVDNQTMTEATAAKTLQDVRARFVGVMPAVELRTTGLVVLRPAPESTPAGELKTLHILRWSPEDEEMSRVELPFSILRWRDAPFRVLIEGEGSGSAAASLRVADIERYGSTLLMDGPLPDGGHVLMWSD